MLWLGFACVGQPWFGPGMAMRRGRKAGAGRSAQGSRLPARLRRVSPWGRQRATAFRIGLPLTAVTSVLLVLLARSWSLWGATGERWAALALVGAFFGVGALLLYT